MGKSIGLISFVLLQAGFSGTFFRAPIRYTENSFEDTVRIAVVYNTPRGSWGGGYCPSYSDGRGICSGYCPSGTRFVGTEMRDFVLTALDPVSIPHIIVEKSTDVSWNDVKNMWPGKLPHVIVHLNAGWYTCNGDNTVEMLDSAASRSIGVVSIGDDAAAFANNFFFFNNVRNVAGPLGDGRWVSELWITLDRANDTLESPGIVRNAVDQLLGGGQRIDFKRYGRDGRCQADADAFVINSEDSSKMRFLGTETGKHGGVTYDDPTGPANAYNTIVGMEEGVRRGLLFSFQPQYLTEPEAVAQIIYDGIIWCAFAHHLVARKTQYYILK